MDVLSSKDCTKKYLNKNKCGTANALASCKKTCDRCEEEPTPVPTSGGPVCPKKKAKKCAKWAEKWNGMPSGTKKEQKRKKKQGGKYNKKCPSACPGFPLGASLLEARRIQIDDAAVHADGGMRGGMRDDEE